MLELSLYFLSFGCGAGTALVMFKGHRIKLTLSLWSGIQCEVVPPEPKDDGERQA